MTGIEKMLRVGVVSSVNASKKQARVHFPDQNNMVSDWLYVLQRGGNYTPSVNDRVLCAFVYGDNTDGFILGVIP